MKVRNPFFSVILCFLLFGCATTARDNKIEFIVESDPKGCPIEVNGVNMGTTPTKIYLGVSKHWIGLAYSSNGWDYGDEIYHVTCFPPPDSKKQLVSQTKTIEPGINPEGGYLYFNLRLKPYVPSQQLEIKKTGKDEITIKDNCRDMGSENAHERLVRLKKLLDEGLITEDEYQKKRKAILEEL